MLEWGRTSYDIIYKDKVVLSKRLTACYADFWSRFSGAYDTVRIYDIDCRPTVEYKNFFLQYVIDMYQIEGSFNDEYFELKTQGNRVKDILVMSTVRLLWETLGGSSKYDTPNLLFKKLRDDECPHEDKLARFCYFYKAIDPDGKYFSEGHSWPPYRTVIKTTNDYLNHKNFETVNGFFTRV